MDVSSSSTDRPTSAIIQTLIGAAQHVADALLLNGVLLAPVLQGSVSGRITIEPTFAGYNEGPTEIQGVLSMGPGSRDPDTDIATYSVRLLKPHWPWENWITPGLVVRTYSTFPVMCASSLQLTGTWTIDRVEVNAPSAFCHDIDTVTLRLREHGCVSTNAAPPGRRVRRGEPMGDPLMTAPVEATS